MKAVLFDADGVVQMGVHFAQPLADRHGWSAAEAEAFMNELWQREEQAQSLIGKSDLLVEVAELLVARAIADDAATFYSELLRRTIVPQDDVLCAVDELRATGVLCALATNQEQTRLDVMADEFGYRTRFDRIFASCEMGLRKPNRDYFEAILDDLGLLAADVLFLDDHPPNVETAREVGLHAAVVENCSDVRGLLKGHGLLI